MADFLSAIIELFSLALTVETYKEILVKVGTFQRGWVTLTAYVKCKGTSPPTIVGVGKLECFATS